MANQNECATCAGLGILSRCCEVDITGDANGDNICSGCESPIEHVGFKECPVCEGEGTDTWEPDEDYWKDR